jgi:hypothetical protein
VSQLQDLRDRIASYAAISETLQGEIGSLRSQVAVMKQEQLNASANTGAMSFADAAKMEVH